MHERGRVKDLEGRRREHDSRQDSLGRGAGERIEFIDRRSHGLPSPVAEQGPKPLPTRQERQSHIRELPEFWRDRRQFHGAFGYKLVDSQLNKVN
ncbi:hypothetical protein GCM10007382_27670 [Salinibacterium xinjiangense]|nr:hypothetical protein GCM10007382_27670 [Salinibacterium xinjiangense]